tara:strand:- start:18878 stop:19129 length:252 start_codon:yes stop_codon:yes gene_type:complete
MLLRIYKPGKRDKAAELTTQKKQAPLYTAGIKVELGALGPIEDVIAAEEGAFASVIRCQSAGCGNAELKSRGNDSMKGAQALT